MRDFERLTFEEMLARVQLHMHTMARNGRLHNSLRNKENLALPTDYVSAVLHCPLLQREYHDGRQGIEVEHLGSCLARLRHARGDSHGELTAVVIRTGSRREPWSFRVS